MNKFFAPLKLTLDESEIQKFRDLITQSNLSNSFYYPKEKLITNGDHNNPKYDFADGNSEIVVDKDFLANSNLSKIINLFSNEESIVKILKFPPKFFVGWHVDVSRKVGFNIPLYDYKSLTLFSDEMATIDDRSKNTKIYDLNYELGKVYLFNASKYHAVVNYDDDYRYMLVILIYSKTGMIYETMIKKLQENNLLD